MISEAEARTGETSTSDQAENKSLRKGGHGAREIYRIINAIIRGAGAGFCIRGGLHLLSWIFAVFSRSRRKLLLAEPGKHIIDQLLDTFRYVLFLGSLSGVYVGVDEAIANRLGRKK